MISLLTHPAACPLERMPGTDLWYMSCAVDAEMRLTYQFLVEDGPEPSENEPDDPLVRWAKYRHDPFNPQSFAFYTDDEDPMGIQFTRSILEMPDAPSQRWVRKQKGVQGGQVEEYNLHSQTLS